MRIEKIKTKTELKRLCHTWIAGTFVTIYITVLSGVTWTTHTGIAIDSINTSSIMLTSQWMAVIYVCLAMFTTEATGTRASMRSIKPSEHVAPF